MIASLAEQFRQLVSTLDASSDCARSELTLFPSGGEMIDVHRKDGRVFVLAFSPDRGFGVDELHVDDGFVDSYQFTFTEFSSAALKLQELVSPSNSPEERPSLKLSLVVVFTHDLDATRDFYSALGLEFQDEQHGGGPIHYSATVGGAVFEIYPMQNNASVGSLRLGFDVQSVDRTFQSLKVRHAKVVSEPRDSPWGRRAVVADPNGNRVELTQQS